MPLGSYHTVHPHVPGSQGRKWPQSRGILLVFVQVVELGESWSLEIEVPGKGISTASWSGVSCSSSTTTNSFSKNSFSNNNLLYLSTSLKTISSTQIIQDAIHCYHPDARHRHHRRHCRSRRSRAETRHHRDQGLRWTELGRNLHQDFHQDPA